MKKTILTLIIGMLIGAIITAGAFTVIRNNEKSKMRNMRQNGTHFNADGSRPSGMPGKGGHFRNQDNGASAGSNKVTANTQNQN